MYDPADVTLPIPATDAQYRHPLHEVALTVPASAAPTDEGEMRRLRAQYYGMISEVDFQLGRVFEAIDARGEWHDTLIVITSDHGEQLGDHGLIEKLGFFPQSYHVIGLWRDPRRKSGVRNVQHFTENVDLLPTLCDALGINSPAQCDGVSLAPLFAGTEVPWRTHAHYEWDYRTYWINDKTARDTVDWNLSRQNLAVSLGEQTAYVQFGDGTFLCFDLAADPTWRTECEDVSRVLAVAQEQLVWRQEHLERAMTDMLLRTNRPGRWPAALVQ
jgi:arylsulfatase A-like enzyme